jgi:hypothetical protein
MNRSWAAVSSVLLFAIHIASAHAINLIVNGSFEEGAFIGDANTSWNSISVGETAVTGWIAGTNGLTGIRQLSLGPLMTVTGWLTSHSSVVMVQYRRPSQQWQAALIL